MSKALKNVQKKSLTTRRRKSYGASSVEYIIVLVLVALAGVAGFQTFGKSVVKKMTDSNSTFDTVTTPK
jgi:Flp pilus assembly pilin Flp